MRPFALLSLLVTCSKAARSPQDGDKPLEVDTPNIPPLIPVPFGHIFKDGVDDPNSDLKRPIDLLEQDLRTPMSRAEAEWLLKQVPKENILRINKKKFEIQDDDEEIKDGQFVETQTTKRSKEGPQWFNFGRLNAENLANPGRTPPSPRIDNSKAIRRIGKIPPSIRQHNITHDKFGIKIPDPYKEIKWTNCTEFARKTSFHPKDIVDIDWTPFYVWSMRYHHKEAVVHRFSYPTKRIVREYKTTYGPHIKKSLDWEQPKLVMNETVEMLLIADSWDRRGLFHAVPKLPVPTDPDVVKVMQLTVPKLRLKIVDPYLAMMFCDDYYATIMAAPGTEPLTEAEKEEEAKILKFTGVGFPVETSTAEIAARKAEENQRLVAEEARLIEAYHAGRKNIMDPF